MPPSQFHDVIVPGYRTLTLYPAIDLRGGYAVRLERGDPSHARERSSPTARRRCTSSTWTVRSAPVRTKRRCARSARP